MNEAKDLLKIPEPLISSILELTRPLRYTSSSNLFYAGQTPIVAYLLLDGMVHLTKNGEVLKTFSRGNVIGLKELMNNETVDVDAQILPGTQVCFIDRSTILNILKQKGLTPLKEQISRLINMNTTLY